MKLFTEHTKRQGVTYMEHLLFAIGIATRLANSVIAFTLHAIFPFIDIKKELDLEETARFIESQNDWIENKKKNTQKNTELAQSPAFQTKWF